MENTEDSFDTENTGIISKYNEIFDEGIYHYHNGNLVQSFYCFTKLAENDIDLLPFSKRANVWRYLGAYYNLGIPLFLHPNKENAIYCFKKLIDIEPNNPDAWFCLGDCYYDPCYHIENADNKLEEYKRNAVDCYKKTLELDNYYSDAYFRLGLCYEYGDGLEKNEEKAFEYVKASADAPGNNCIHWLKLANYFLNGIGTYKDEKQAFECIKNVVKLDSNNAEYCYYLGVMYREGIGTDKNSEKAFEYIKKAADLDNDNAQYCYDLSNLYDLQKEDTAILSFEYLKKAVEKDPTNPIYCYTLGTFYTKGVGTEKNNKEGLKYFKKAADFAGAEGIKFFPQIFEFFEDEDFINDSSNSEEVFAFLKKYSNLGISCTLSNKDGTKSVNLDDIDLETFRSFFKNDNQ